MYIFDFIYFNVLYHFFFEHFPATNILVMNPITKVKPSTPYTQVDLEHAMDIVKSAFSECAERDIYTGDDVEILILKPGQPIQREKFPLRMD